MNHAAAAVARRLSLPIAIVALGVVCVVGVTKPLAEWQAVYLLAARELVTGRDIYAHGQAYLYPPFAAVLAIPFTYLSDIAGRIAFRALNVAAIVVLARSAWRLSGGGRLDATTPSGRREWAVAALGAVVAIPYAMNTLAHQQTDLLIAALVIAGCDAVSRGRRLAGAALIGVGAAFKGPPLLFAAYFLARRRWLEAGVTGGVAIVLNLIPDLLARAPGGGLWLTRWISLNVLKYQKPSDSLGHWGSDLIYNQSLAGTLQRLAGALVETHVLKAAAYGLMLAMLGWTIWRAWRGERNAAGEPPSSPSRFALECGAVIVLMLLISPMSGLAHFPVMVLPALCMARLAIEARSLGARLAIGLASAAALATGKDLVGGAVYDFVLWIGLTTFAAIGLWAGCVAAFSKPPPPASP